jgi:hypothetical protein
VQPSDPTTTWCGTELALLVPDPHRHAAGDDEPELLVFVMVLGHRDIGLQVDDCHRHALAFNSTGRDALAERVRPDFSQRLESLCLGFLHSITRSMIVAVPIPPPQHIVSSP